MHHNGSSSVHRQNQAHPFSGRKAYTTGYPKSHPLSVGGATQLPEAPQMASAIGVQSGGGGTAPGAAGRWSAEDVAVSTAQRLACALCAESAAWSASVKAMHAWRAAPAPPSSSHWEWMRG